MRLILEEVSKVILSPSSISINLFLSISYFFCYAEAFEFDVVVLVDCCFCCVVGFLSRKSLPRLIWQRLVMSFIAMLYSDSFMVSGFMFKPLMHFKLIFMSCVR